MMTNKNVFSVYKLSWDCEKYLWCNPVDVPFMYFDDFFKNNKSIKDKWKVMDIKFYREGVEDTFKVTADFSMSMSIVPLFSKKAYDRLNEFLNPYGEFLEFNCLDKIYYGFHILTYSPSCLDMEKSEFKYFTDGGIMRVKKHIFIKENTQELVIFKSSQTELNTIYVTNVFKEFIEKTDLTGFEFKQVWSAVN